MNRTSRLAAVVLLALAPLSACGGEDEMPTIDSVVATETVTVTATPSPTPAPSQTPSEEPTAEPSEPAESPTAPAVDLSQPPTSFTEAEAHFAAATGDEIEARRFQSPNGFYYCVLENRFIPTSCEVLEGVRDPEACADAPSQLVGRVELSDAGWAPVCNTDTIRMPGGPTAEPGTVVTSAGLSVRCLVESIGLTCVEPADGSGFFLGPGRYQVF